jgi:hypothetical protein
MINDISNIEAEIKCRNNHQRALQANPRELARGAIWEIREANRKAGLSQKDPNGDKPFVHYPLDLLNMAEEKDPKNIGRYAKIRAFFYESKARIERRNLVSTGIQDDFSERYTKWQAEREAAISGGYYRAVGFACAPKDHYHYVKEYESEARAIRAEYGLKNKEEMKGDNN